MYASDDYLPEKPFLQLRDADEAHRLKNVFMSPEFLVNAFILLLIPYPSSFKASKAFTMDVWNPHDRYYTVTYYPGTILLLFMWLRLYFALAALNMRAP